MKVRKLTENEIIEILEFSDVNSRKSHYQKIIQEELIRNKKVLLELFTRGGKGYLASSFCKLLRTKYSEPIIVLVHNSKLKSDWETILKDVDNVHVYIVNSYTSKSAIESLQTTFKYHREGVICIADEIHRYSNAETQMQFYKALQIIDTRYLLCLSAMVKKVHKDFLESIGVHFNFFIPLETGYKLGVVPNFTHYNLAIHLTKDEQKQYVEIQNEYNQVVEFFDKISPDNATRVPTLLLPSKVPYRKFGGLTMTAKDWLQHFSKETGINAGLIINKAVKWRTLVGQRMNLLYKAENKVNTALDFLKTTNKKVLVFVKRIEDIKRIMKEDSQAIGFHSKMTDEAKKQAMKSFYNNEKPHLVSCDSLVEGLEVLDCDLILNLGFNSSVSDAIQKTGRLLLIDNSNKLKHSKIVNFYIDNFIHNNIEIKSQDLIWLERNQKQISFVEWIDSTDEIQ